MRAFRAATLLSTPGSRLPTELPVLIKRPRSLLRPSGELNSLFGEILDWLLAPLLFLWPITIVATHHIANKIADAPYDKSLADNVRAISRQVRTTEGRVQLYLPAPARALLHADEEDTVYYQVLGPGGELVSGDKDIPRPEASTGTAPADVLFRNDEIQGDDVRIAWQFLPSGQKGRYIAVQVAETRAKRASLARKIASGVLLPQFVIIPLAVILVYLGLGRGIAPLNRLKRLIERRRPTDLAPINVEGVPDEVRPLIIAFNDMMARLEQTLNAQQRFIGDAAHQMRTPLTGLMMQAEVALMESDPAQVRACLERIAASAQRAAHLINQLLALARAESSFEQIHNVQKVDLEQVGLEVASDLTPAAMARHIDLGYEGVETPLTVDGNPLLLKEMAKNLLDNAIKYTPPGGKVTVRVRHGEDGGPILEVEDSGIGIAEEERERVFERFYRVLGSGAEGSGLGLAIVNEIADLHQATVTLLPNPVSPGTVARVSFPPPRPNGNPAASTEPRLPS
ncbi:MAG: sensor histidine kinase N-terminal domain-containing protein [Rhodocyclaceae bacterium]|nr:sensor histidine kinase N-terminal domain-containing protein [Rhodocyclaceae bacterium]